MNRERWVILGMLIGANVSAGLIWWMLRLRFEYNSPLFFWCLLIIPLLSIHYFFSQSGYKGSINIGDTQALKSLKTSMLGEARHGLFSLQMAGLAFLIIALARPQSSLSYEDLTKEGIDIVLAMDVSHSMLAQDFKPNRLASAKKVAARFIDDRPDDRIGLVVYEGESFTQVPITTDHKVLKDGMKEISPGWITGGTAIGLGLATSVNRLKESEAKSKVVILLTDGVNNSGQVKPVDAAHIAKAFNVRVYTIGIGTQGMAKTPVRIYENGTYDYEYVQVEIDEEVLREIASITNGEYFRATDEASLRDIYQKIDELERTKFNVTKYSNKTEEFFGLAFIGLLLLVGAFVLSNTLFRTTP